MIGQALDMPSVRNLVCGYYMANEGISILENTVKAELPTYTILCKNLRIEKIKKNRINTVKKFSEKKKGNTPFSDEAQHAAFLLCFAFKLYTHILNQDKDLLPETENIICRLAKNSFPIAEIPSDDDLDSAYKICFELDSFFAKNKKYVAKIGEAAIGQDIRLLYDDNFFYIKSTIITEILKINGSKLRFSKKIKEALAKDGYIKVYKKDSGIEYTVHLPKYISDKLRTSQRYIAFDRKICLEQGEFFSKIDPFVMPIRSLKSKVQNT